MPELQDDLPMERSGLADIDVRLAQAQAKTWEAVAAISALMRPGMLESEAIAVGQRTLAAMGARKFWHKCHVRFGANTVRSFEDPYTDVELRQNDIYFLDIGPIWDGIEGDAGATFTVGTDPEMARCQADAPTIFAAVKEHWLQSGASGRELYACAAAEAQARGWILTPSYVRGHRLSEFPHSFHSKLRVDALDFAPAPRRWVLEIQICDPGERFGAFYEDLL